jgi:nitroreductase
MIRDLVIRNRSYRRFREEVDIRIETLKELVDLARLSASAMNSQPLKYILSCDRQKNSLIFPHLVWATFLKTWPGPAEGERPSAYIVILGDTEIGRFWDYDAGIAAQSILLGATENDLGGCMIANVRKEDLRRALGIPERYEVLLVVALGRPGEKVVVEKVGSDGDTKYWRDSEGVHHVPKRRLDEILIGELTPLTTASGVDKDLSERR